eukprot:Sspe_Gene.5396::Locus_1781_Transcript_1_1_Confidence_1.000_Length_4100::g.5396::m.5396/K14326/UPF1, RENT1; regulator of nonsense transcripts 1
MNEDEGHTEIMVHLADPRGVLGQLEQVGGMLEVDVPGFTKGREVESWTLRAGVRGGAVDKVEVEWGRVVCDHALDLMAARAEMEVRGSDVGKTLRKFAEVTGLLIGTGVLKESSRAAPRLALSIGETGPRLDLEEAELHRAIAAWEVMVNCWAAEHSRCRGGTRCSGNRRCLRGANRGFEEGRVVLSRRNRPWEDKAMSVVTSPLTDYLSAVALLAAVEEYDVTSLSATLEERNHRRAVVLREQQRLQQTLSAMALSKRPMLLKGHVVQTRGDTPHVEVYIPTLGWRGWIDLASHGIMYDDQARDSLPELRTTYYIPQMRGSCEIRPQTEVELSCDGEREKVGYATKVRAMRIKVREEWSPWLCLQHDTALFDRSCPTCASWRADTPEGKYSPGNDALQNFHRHYGPALNANMAEQVTRRSPDKSTQIFEVDIDETGGFVAPDWVNVFRGDFVCIFVAGGLPGDAPKDLHTQVTDVHSVPLSEENKELLRVTVSIPDGEPNPFPGKAQVEVFTASVMSGQVDALHKFVESEFPSWLESVLLETGSIDRGVAEESDVVRAFRDAGCDAPDAVLTSCRDTIRDLNARQVEVVHNVATQRVTLVQGPPGTGKTWVMTGVVKMLATFNSAVGEEGKVLYCTQSNKSGDAAHRFLQKLDLRFLRVLSRMKEREILGLTRCVVDEDNEFDPSLSGYLHEKVATGPLGAVIVALRQLLRDIARPERCNWSKDLDEATNTAKSELKKYPSEFVNGIKTETEEAIMLGSVLGVLARFEKDAVPSYNDFGCSATSRMSLHSRLNQAYEKLVAFAEREYIREANVIMCTSGCVGVGRLDKTHFSQVLVDEAGQLTVCELLVPLVRFGGDALPRLVLVGDHKQFAPVVESRLSVAKRLKTSSFPRLVKKYQASMILLNEQYRMPPEIAEFSNNAFYEGRLVTRYRKNPRWKDLAANMTVFSHSFLEEKVNTSYRNQDEARELFNFARMLYSVEGVLFEEMLVITPYKEQAKLLKHMFQGTAARVATIHSIQGCEERVVLVSFVRSSDIPTKFMTDEQINVMLTRSQQGRFIFCNGSLADNRSGHTFYQVVMHHERKELVNWI